MYSGGWSVVRPSDDPSPTAICETACMAKAEGSGQSDDAQRDAAALRETLTRFVVRLRLITAHSLAADREQLDALSRHDMTFQITKYRDGRAPDVAMRPIELVPIEQLESAVARVRPLLLRSDGIGYAQVFEQLRGVLGEDEVGALSHARERFEAFDPDYPRGRPRDHHEPGAPVSNRQLAGAWLYGSLVHADAVRQSYAAHVTLEALQVEAQRVVAGLLLASLDALELLRRLTAEGRLEVEDSAWAVEVVASKPSWAPTVTNVYTAPIGTPMPTSVDEPLAPEWESWRGKGSSTSDDS